MTNYRVPHYPKDADYQTNAGSYYDDLARKNELLKHLAYRIWEYDKELSKRFLQWDQMLDDGLGAEVNRKLDEWLADGTLESILSGTFDSKLDKILFEDYVLQMQSLLTTKQNIDTLPFVDVRELKNRNNLTDTQALQQALDVAIIKGAVHVVIPAGMELTLEEELKIHSHTLLEAMPGVILHRAHQGYMLMNGNRNTEDNPTTASRYNAHQDITVIGGTWDAHGTDYTTQASIFRFSHARDITVRDVELLDCSKSHHIEINACRDVRVSDSSFKGVVGATLFNEAIQLDVAKRGVTNIGLDDGTPCLNVWIENCYFGDSGTPGTESISRAIGSHTSTMGQSQRNIFITNCVFENMKSFTIRAYNWENVTIAGNTFLNVGAGINIRSGMTGVGTEDANGQQVGSLEISSFTITENLFNGWKGAGRLIEIYGETGTAGWVKDVTLTGNTFNMSGNGDTYDCVAIVVSKDVSIHGNEIKNAKGNAINVVGSEQVIISGNGIYSSGKDGILISGSLNTLINGNSLTRTMRNGIYLSDNDGFTVTGNIIHGVNAEVHEDDFNPVRAVTNNRNGGITGNVIKTHAAPYTTSVAIYVTETGVNIMAKDNVTPGFINAIRPVNGTLDEHGNIT